MTIAGIDVFELYGLACLLIIGSFAIVLLIAAQLSEDKEQGIFRQVWHTFFGGDDDREYPADFRNPQDKD